MQKIMFDDSLYLTQAVKDGRKTKTRRIIPQLVGLKDFELSDWGIDEKGRATISVYQNGKPVLDLYPRYQPGEVVAVAERYEDLANSKYCDVLEMMDSPTTFKKEFCGIGWDNKMYVKAEYMPTRIVITDVGFQQLQDIDEEDCIKEGVQRFATPNGDVYIAGGIRLGENDIERIRCGRVTVADVIKHDTAVDAFRAIINKTCKKIDGKPCWDANPWVWVYELELQN